MSGVPGWQASVQRTCHLSPQSPVRRHSLRHQGQVVDRVSSVVLATQTVNGSSHHSSPSFLHRVCASTCLCCPNLPYSVYSSQDTDTLWIHSRRYTHIPTPTSEEDPLPPATLKPWL